MTRHVLPRLIAVFLAVVIVGGFIPTGLDSIIDGPSNYEKLFVTIVVCVALVIVVALIYLVFGLGFRQGILESILVFAVVFVIGINS